MSTFEKEGNLSVVSKADIQMNYTTHIYGADSCDTLIGSESLSSNGELAAAATYAVVSTRSSIPKSPNTLGSNAEASSGGKPL